MDTPVARHFTQKSIDIHKEHPELWGSNCWVSRRGGRTRWCILGGAAALSLAAEGRTFTTYDIVRRGGEIAYALNLPCNYELGPLATSRTAGPAIAWLVEHVEGLRG